MVSFRSIANKVTDASQSLAQLDLMMEGTDARRNPIRPVARVSDRKVAPKILWPRSKEEACVSRLVLRDGSIRHRSTDSWRCDRCARHIKLSGARCEDRCLNGREGRESTNLGFEMI